MVKLLNRFKKKKKKPIPFYRQLRDAKRGYWIMVFVNLILCLLVFYNIYFISSSLITSRVVLGVNGTKQNVAYLRPDDSKPLIIDLSKLFEDEKEIAKNLTLELNPLYLHYQHSIVFTHDICHDAFVKKVNEKDSVFCGIDGFNINGVIYVDYKKDVDAMKRILCHELVHTYTLPPFSRDPEEDPIHAFVYAVGDSRLCFTDFAKEYVEIPKKIMFAE